MPGDNIEWREILFSSEEFAAKFLNNCVFRSQSFLKPCRWCKKISWCSKTIGTCTHPLIKIFKHTIRIYWSGYNQEELEYLLVQDQEAGNEHHRFQQHNHATSHPVDRWRNGILVVWQQFHQETPKAFHTRFQSIALKHPLKTSPSQKNLLWTILNPLLKHD